MGRPLPALAVPTSLPNAHRCSVRAYSVRKQASNPRMRRKLVVPTRSRVFSRLLLELLNTMHHAPKSKNARNQMRPLICSANQIQNAPVKAANRCVGSQQRSTPCLRRNPAECQHPWVQLCCEPDQFPGPQNCWVSMCVPGKTRRHGVVLLPEMAYPIVTDQATDN